MRLDIGGAGMRKELEDPANRVVKCVFDKVRDFVH